MQERHYINLTNGIEALPALVADASKPGWSFMRLQSTTIERQDWIKLFLCDVSDDLLMHLALGWRCIVHDRGTRRPLSKTIYYGLPLIKYVLDRRWYDLRPEVVVNRGRRGGLGTNVVRQFSAIYDDLFVHCEGDRGRVKRRVDYFKRYLPHASGTDAGAVLEGACVSTEHDGDREYYASLVRGVLAPEVQP